MIVMLCVAAAVAPGLFWVYFVKRFDAEHPEPARKLVKAFFVGIGSVFLALLLIIPFELTPPFIQQTIGAGFGEEMAKLILFMIFIYRDKDFDEPIDGIIYAAMIALGFATLENIFYVVDGLSTGQVLQVAVLRAFLSVPGHMLFSTIFGFHISLMKFSSKAGPEQPVIGYLVAAGAHAAFNLSAMAPIFVIVVLIIYSVLLWRLFGKHVKELKGMRGQ
jgi:RsiW-degrading membrane proteinase PrsW (M82 family)